MLGHPVLLECIPRTTTRQLICRAFWQASRGHGYTHRNRRSTLWTSLSPSFSTTRKRFSVAEPTIHVTKCYRSGTNALPAAIVFAFCSHWGRWSAEALITRVQRHTDLSV